MYSNRLQSALITYTARTSGHEVRRKYIGLSGIGDCAQVIYDRFMFGDRHSPEGRLKDSLCYALEGVLISRLTEMGVYSPAKAITLFDGLVQGHPDGVVSGDLLEIKTIERAEWIPSLRSVGAPHLPNRIFYQVQAYMHYGGYDRAHVLYLARDTGELRVIGVSRHPSIAERIEARIAVLVGAIRAHQRPECSCGHCRSQENHAEKGEIE